MVSAYQLHWGDIVAIVGYFIFVLIVGIVATRMSTKGSTSGYFLAGKSMIWLPIGASIFASNIGAPVLVGLSGTAAASGIGGMIFEWHAIPFIIALGWVFVPVFIASGVYTMPEYLKRRYGGERLRLYLSALSIIVYIITRVSAEMYAGSLFVNQLLGWNMYISGVLILLFSAAFTMAGGLTAVLYTDTLQTCVFIIGSIILLISTLNKVGGYSALLTKYMHAIPNTTLASNTTCGMPREDSLHLLRDPLTSDYPWPGTLIINSCADVWFWCADQIMVQRALSAKSLSHAKGGCILAGYLKILPFFMFVLPGMAARVLFPDEIGCADPVVCMSVCQNPNGCSNLAYPMLVLRVMQPGFRGIMLAALFAACMSTLTSVFNSASSIFTMDLWKRFRKQAGQWELLVVGRLTVLVLCGLAIIWIPIMEKSQGAELWKYWQSLMSYVGPPWAVVFILGFFWKRTTEPAAFYGMVIGQLIGLIRIVLTIVYPEPPCGEVDDRPTVLKIHFLYVAGIEIAVSTVIIVSVSLVTKPRPNSKLCRVTFWTRHAKEFPEQDSQMDKLQIGIEETDELTESVLEDNLCKRRLESICGITQQQGSKMTKEELDKQRQRLTNITESMKTKWFLHVNAIILFATATFIIAFYA